MDKIRVSKVENVTLCRRGDQFYGTLHLTQHHIIFSYLPPTPAPSTPPSAAKQRAKELWITYPMISYCTFKPMPAAYRQPCSIRLRCRDFNFVAFQLDDALLARDVYDTVKSLSCLNRIDKLYAFKFQPPPAEKEVDGWGVYDARLEFKRMGISPKYTDRGWRLSHINKDYSYSPTYPALLVVPSAISDFTLRHGGGYRSKTRIPALSYLHSVNNCSITRSAQPLVGMFQGKRNAQDERLVSAIFATCRPITPTSDAAGLQAVTEQAQGAEDGVIPEADASSLHGSVAFTMDGEDVQATLSKSSSDLSTTPPEIPRIYGAQQNNFIVDARPQVNAIANQATGMGSENMEYYKDATKEYLGIPNIHVMRDSLNKVFDACANSDYTNFPPNQDLLAKSKWLDYIATLLRGADLVARQVGINHSHVLIHCSDGWDRTSQISALSQICLDPYYRTLEGFVVLVEKDFLSFGHMFKHRSGFLGSEKWFQIENERVGGAPDRKEQNPTISGSGGGNGTSNAFENALFAAKGFFNKKNDSKESLDIDPEDLAPRASPSAKADKHATKVKETSPIFHQFLEATYQLLLQHPTRFEFNERFLRRLLYQLYSCQYGTFLLDSERERVEANLKGRTRSVWDHFLSRREQFVDRSYDGTIDDNIPGKERLLFPNVRKVKWWPELYGRTDEEMNGTPNAPAMSLPRESGILREPLVTGVENSVISVGPTANATNGNRINSPQPQSQQQGITGPIANGVDQVSAGLTGLSFGAQSASPPSSKAEATPTSASESHPQPSGGFDTELSDNSDPLGASEFVSSPTMSSAKAPRKREDMFSAFARENAFRES